MEYKKGYKFTTNISKLFLRQFEDKLSRKKVIDLGCGQGGYLEFFGKGSFGVDLSNKNIAAAQKRGLKVIQADMNHPPHIKNKFEVVFSSHLIEHLENPVNFLKYSNRLLKKKGLLVLSVPNENSYICLKYPYFNGKGNHLYSFSISNMEELLKVSGFKVKQVYRDYSSSLSQKLHIDFIWSIINLFPTSIKNYFSWAFWFEAEKI